MLDIDLVAYTRDVASQIDRTFREAMVAVGKRGGAGLRERHPRGFAPTMIEFRTSLGRPGGAVLLDDFNEVMRYRDRTDVDAAIMAAVQCGAIERNPDGTIRATDVGHAYVDDLYATQDLALSEVWAPHEDRVTRIAPLLAELVRAAALLAARPGAFRAMEPAYEPDGISERVLTLNRLSALRYFRSDAHATAWRGAGLTAAEMVGLQESGDPRAYEIELRTNELAAPAFAGLSAADRVVLLADLSGLTAGQ